MKPERKIQHNLLISLLLILILSISCFSQTSESNEESDVIPEQVMKQIVRKVLIHYFKPRSQKRVVYLSKNEIQQSWLPKIKGVKFQLLNPQQDRGTHHYTFRDFDKHTIGFGYGYSGSGFNGDIWHFRFSKQTLKIWKSDNEGFGSSGIDHGLNYFETPPIIKKQNQ
jgi:hypothetical protein